MNAVDTNVLVYLVDSEEPTKQRQAVQLLDDLANDPVPTVLLWQAAAEFLSCMRRWEAAGRITRSDTLAYLQQLDAMFANAYLYPKRPVLDISLDLSSRYSLSHWDSMLLAACVEAGVQTLYTEDLDTGMSYDTVTVVNPFVESH